jgi:hypothetical protein
VTTRTPHRRSERGDSGPPACPACGQQFAIATDGDGRAVQKCRCGLRPIPRRTWRRRSGKNAWALEFQAKALAYIVAHNPPALADPFLTRLSGMMRKWNLLGRRNGQRL